MIQNMKGDIISYNPNDIEFWYSDINGDGTINVLDVVQLVSTILNGQ